jgi:hypothetical protein
MLDQILWLTLTLVMLIGSCVVVGSRGHTGEFDAPERPTSVREYR